MGYRSHVIFGVEEPLVASLLTALSQEQEAFDLLFSYAQVTKEDDGCILFNLDYVKWYEGYNCVDCIVAWMHSLTDEEEEHFVFHRLGEEFGDHASAGFSERWSIYPNQYLEVS